MHVIVLHLVGPGAASRAFDLVLDCVDVDSCVIEPEAARIRFLAPAKVAAALAERIYLDGGLRWCTRHEIVSPDRVVVPLHRAGRQAR